MPSVVAADRRDAISATVAQRMPRPTSTGTEKRNASVASDQPRWMVARRPTPVVRSTKTTVKRLDQMLGILLGTAGRLATTTSRDASTRPSIVASAGYVNLAQRLARRKRKTDTGEHEAKPSPDSVLQRLGDIVGDDRRSACEVGDRAGHAQNAVVRPAAEREAFDGRVQQRPPGVVGPARTGAASGLTAARSERRRPRCPVRPVSRARASRAPGSGRTTPAGVRRPARPAAARAPRRGCRCGPAAGPRCGRRSDRAAAARSGRPAAGGRSTRTGRGSSRPPA